jgi:hypothetical protein
LIERLSIRNFRAFDEFEIPKLGHLNLIGGANSVGKSSLLAALAIYSSWRPAQTLERFLRAQDVLDTDAGESSAIFGGDSEDNRFALLSSLFHSETAIGSEFSISSQDHELKVQLVKTHLRQLEEVLDASGNGPVRVVSEKSRFDLSILRNESPVDSLDSAREGSRRFFEPRAVDPSGIAYIDSKGLGRDEMVPLWDALDLTPMKAKLLELMRLVHPSIQDLSFPSSSVFRRRSRIPQVLEKGADTPIPLSRLGEGSLRLLGIALGVLNSKGRVLLIDEIENGLHHSIHLDLWRNLASLAKELDIQVFATTHSQDMVSAFRVACATDDGIEGVYLKLVDRKGKRKAIAFEEDELVRADLAGVELR